MPIDVTITIKGLCLCFLKEHPPLYPNEKIWNVIFVCDKRHQLRFEFPTPDNPPPVHAKNLHMTGSDLFIDFLSSDSYPQASAGAGNTNLLNMADTDFHGPNKLRIQRKSRPRNCDQIWMRVPRATLDAKPGSKSQWIKEVDNNDPPKPIGDPICKGNKAEEVILRFRFEGVLRVTVGDGNGSNSFDETFTETGTNLAFSFNNKCNIGMGGINDFVDIYDSLKDDSSPPGRRFIVGKSVKCPKNKSRKILDRVSTELMTPAANCDPVGSEPPPGP